VHLGATEVVKSASVMLQDVSVVLVLIVLVLIDLSMMLVMLVMPATRAMEAGLAVAPVLLECLVSSALELLVMQEVEHLVDLAVPSVLILLVLFAKMVVSRIAALLDRLVALVLVVVLMRQCAHLQQQSHLVALPMVFQVAWVKIATASVSLLMTLQVPWGLKKLWVSYLWLLTEILLMMMALVFVVVVQALVISWVMVLLPVLMALLASLVPLVLLMFVELTVREAFLMFVTSTVWMELSLLALLETLVVCAGSV